MNFELIEFLFYFPIIHELDFYFPVFLMKFYNRSLEVLTHPTQWLAQNSGGNSGSPQPLPFYYISSSKYHISSAYITLHMKTTLKGGSYTHWNVELMQGKQQDIA